jgi:hypothetical protein
MLDVIFGLVSVHAGFELNAETTILPLAYFAKVNT